MKYFAILLWACFSLNAQKDSSFVAQQLALAKQWQTTAPAKADSLYKTLAQQLDSTRRPQSFYELLLAHTTLKYHQGRYQQGIELIQRNLAHLKRSQLQDPLKKTHYHLGLFNQLLGNYPQATESYLSAIGLAEKAQDTALQLLALNNLSNIQTDIGLTDQAFANYKKILPLAQQRKDYELAAMALLNQQDINLQNEDLDAAQQNATAFKKLASKITNNRLHYHYHKNLSEIYLKPSLFNLSLAQGHALEAQAYITKENVPYETAYSYYILGKVYQYQNPKKALNHLKKCLALADQIAAKNIALNAHFELQQLYLKEQNFKKAHQHAAKFIALNDSLIGEKNRKIISTLTTQYETEKKNLEISKQQLTIEQQENKLLRQDQQFTSILVSGILFLIIAIGALFFFRQRHQLAKQQIKSLGQKQEIDLLAAVIKGEEKERQRIAQELHDGINGDLAALKFQLGALATAPNTTNTSHQNSLQLLDQSIKSVRHIAHNLAPPAIEDFGLIAAVKQLCHKLNENSSTNFIFQYFGTMPQQDPITQTMVYRILQELCHNIIKHAQATEALVQFNFTPDGMHITVEDNGVGFNPTTKKTGIGLDNLNSRLHFLGATMELVSNQKGSSFILEIPKNKPQVND